MSSYWHKRSFFFELPIAEIISWKKNAELLSLTIRNELTASLKLVAENDIIIVVKAKMVACTFDRNSDGQSKSLRVSIYVGVDLACYGMILGKEGISVKRCHLCKLSHEYFSVLEKNGERWLYNERTELANWFALPSRKSRIQSWA